MELRRIGVVGAGAIGAGIAQLCVQSGLEVVLIDETEEVLGWAEDRVLRGLHRAEQPGAFSLMRKVTDLGGLDGCDFAIESDPVHLETRKDRVCKIDARLSPELTFAIHTDALPVYMVAPAAESPERLVGMRFFSPVPTSSVIEVIAPEQASEGAVRNALDLAARLGKTAVRAKDSPGFITNRLLRPFILVPMKLLEQGRGSPAAIDSALHGGGFLAGPFEFVDNVGLEEDLRVSSLIYDLLGRPERLRPCAVEEKLVSRGCRGRKNSRGFYVYGENPPGTMNPLLAELVSGLGKRPASAPEIVRLVLEAVLAEAKTMAMEAVATASDIDTAMRLGMGWQKGPFEWEGEISR